MPGLMSNLPMLRNAPLRPFKAKCTDFPLGSQSGLIGSIILVHGDYFRVHSVLLRLFLFASKTKQS